MYRHASGSRGVDHAVSVLSTYTHYVCRKITEGLMFYANNESATSASFSIPGISFEFAIPVQFS